jgi:hypothetical protein
MTQLKSKLPGVERESPEHTRAEAPESVARAPSPGKDWGRVAAVGVQCALIVLVIRWFELVSAPFADVAVLVLVGFLIHHFLPASWRLPFFAGLSIASVPLAIGIPNGLCVVGAGFVMIAICHLRWPLKVRLVLLALAAIVLAELRMGLLNPLNTKVPWVVLGSMFMFRVIIYLYDQRHKAAPFSFFRATSYFFMLPNVCFAFFPIVDYKTFCTTYYNEAPAHIYQRGLRWMLRGLMHLLLYRLLYQFMQVDPLDVTDLGGVAQFMVTTYLLYLRVSGEFHLITGMLHLFGFNLPETHHLYLLSSSFTDFWRRINIYWKDFIQKIFFYPAYFRLKHLGPVKAMVLATLYAFFFTWLLHGYQMFWIRGTFSFPWQDTVFWWVLTALVLASALYEMKRGRQRALHKAQHTIRANLGLALRTIGTFLVICTLWTIWYNDSTDELIWLLRQATHVTPRSLALILVGLVGLGAAGILFGRSSAERTESSRGMERTPDTFAFWPAAVSVTAGACGILLLGALPSHSAVRDTKLGDVLASLKQDRLNDTDQMALRRGYYEELDVAHEDFRVRADVEPVSWMFGLNMVKPTNDFMLHEIRPNRSVQAHGKKITTNRWGMRGRTFEKTKAAGVYRIAILGSSSEYGWGVSDDDVLDKLIEDQLNREDTTERIRKFEVMNFSVEGYGAFQKLMLLGRKVLAFEPDLVLYVTYLAEGERTADTLGQAMNENLPSPAEFRESIQNVYDQARVDPSMTRKRIERRVKPYMQELVGEVFQSFADQCRQHNVRGCFVYRPETGEAPRLVEARRRELLSRAEQTGLPVLDLSAAFAGVPDRGAVMVTPKRSYDLQSLKREEMDDHPNELGHRLLADELLKMLRTPEGQALLKP